jgi:adenosine kinase
MPLLALRGVGVLFCHRVVLRDQSRRSGQNVSVIVTGSLAYDHIMRFPGYFKDHILPDKIHQINLSFLVSSLEKQRGGTGGNIAYTAALLGLTPRLLVAAGNDSGAYLDELAALGVDTSVALRIADDVSPSGFITTDNADNQITGFYPGAMNRAGERSLREVVKPDDEMAIISADSLAAMRRYPAECRELGIPYIYDLGMGLPILSDDDLREGLTGAHVLIGNDYEIALIEQKTGFDRAALRERVKIIITTLGEHGAEIDTAGEVIRIPVAPAREVVDPTGAGDAFRGGLLLGLTRGFSLPIAGRLAAQAATYAVEGLGTQVHRYTHAEFAARFNETYPDMPPLGADLRPTAVSVGD